MNDALRSRLVNFKFSQATCHLEGESDEIKELVAALSDLFENSGCFGGKMGIIISAALNSIGAKEFDELKI